MIQSELARLEKQPGPGECVAIGVGSRGITNYAEIVRACVDHFCDIGANPFLIPAMGSHGGATAAGQTQLLADYGITEESMGISIRASMESRKIGQTASGYDIWTSAKALAADHIFVINRIKPHTDFIGDLGSGCLKMLTIGAGKRDGAAHYHQCAIQHGYEAVLREIGSALLDKLPVLGGMAIVEDQHHQTTMLELLQPDDWIPAEERLFRLAKLAMPRIPFTNIDLLIIDRIGKNISGTGMDTNIIGRDIHSYSTLLAKSESRPPHIKRIFVRGLTPETHGNAIGIGLADFTLQSLVEQTDLNATRINSLTSLGLHAAKVPIACKNDSEAIELALASACVTDPAQARILWIEDTLNLETMRISEAMLEDATDRRDLQVGDDVADLPS